MSGASDLQNIAAKKHLMNWRRRKNNRGRNKKKVKEVVIILFKKTLKSHLVGFWPRPYYSSLPLTDIGAALLFLAWTFHLQTSVPLPFLHSVPDSELPWKQTPEPTGVLWPLCKTAQQSFFNNRICQRNSSLALLDLPDAPRRRAGHWMELEAQWLIHFIHYLGGKSKTLLREDEKDCNRRLPSVLPV